MMKLIAPVSPLARVVAQPECLTNTLDRYEFVAKIGEGSFGSVGEYLDRKNRFARVAIKTIAASERDTFVQECEILSQLRSNAHVTSMLHSFEENRKCYLVMKRADRTLARLIQETGPMDPPSISPDKSHSGSRAFTDSDGHIRISSPTMSLSTTTCTPS